MTQKNLPELKHPSINPLLLTLLVIVLAAVGSAFVLRFVAIEQGRELLSWQNKLGLIADSRAADIEAWLDRHFKELGDVAANPSLQLYLTELQNETDARSAPAEDPAQAVFLRNLLSLTADRLGFVEKPSQELKSINADVRQPSGTGLAIIDRGGKVLVATAGLPVLDPNVAAKVEQAPQSEPSLIDIYTTDSGDKRLGFMLPIYAIDSDSATAQPIAHLVGIKNVGDDLFKLLHQPGASEKTLEAVLLRREGDNAVYLSPRDNDQNAADQLALNTPDLDAAYALSSPGSFAVKKDAQSHVTLMTSRVLAHSPWTLLLHIDRKQALGESDTWLRQIEYSLFLALLAVSCGIIAVWYYGTSKRTLLLSQETQRLAAQSMAQEKLLRVVTDNQLEPIFIADRDNVARFANAKAAQTFHLETQDVAGKELIALMGGVYAKGYVDANHLALTRHAPYVRTWSRESGSGVNVIRSEHIPLEHIPIEGLPVPSPGVLTIDQDITEVVNEREHRMRILRQLVNMLVLMVDRRDPYAANHSACVALVARAIALGMGLDQTLVETAEVAGNLMNTGKIVVPSALLTKSSALTEGEMRQVRESLQSSIALLENIEFDGPVVDTLRQSQERYDGTGPLRLKGDAILVTARIIAVANAFVGMVSLRSYRTALTIDQAIKGMLASIDIQFDRRVVVALADYVENRQGRDAIAQLISKKINAAD
jgi:HD-GYP domain-containing protein (c-di-GMP phosphodiesterase class II)